MVFKTFFLLAGILLSIQDYGKSQAFFRIKTDYSIKYKDSDGNAVLQAGALYYDINHKTVVMRNGFPIKEIIAHKDSIIYQIQNNSVVSSEKTYAPVELTVFHLALSGNLENFGLKKAGYKLAATTEDKGLLLNTWLPPDNMEKTSGKIVISIKDKHLFGIVFFDLKDRIIARHFFRNYTNVKGFVFPTEVLKITYENGKEISVLTNYSKILVNSTSEEEFYKYKIPDK
jgi:hypothetical protein